MEFPFNVNKFLLNDVTVVTKGSFRRPRTAADLCLADQDAIVDRMGAASRVAQGLPSIITTADRLRASDHRLYIAKDGEANSGHGRVLGILKVGEKKLFVANPDQRLEEMDPTCVLDFYVHESCQRQGVGKILFETMLQEENRTPWKLAYDKPSKKFLGFLKKYHQLSRFTPQGNNFVVFHEYWHPKPKPTLEDHHSTTPECHDRDQGQPLGKIQQQTSDNTKNCYQPIPKNKQQPHPPWSNHKQHGYGIDTNQEPMYAHRDGYTNSKLPTSHNHKLGKGIRNDGLPNINTRNSAGGSRQPNSLQRSGPPKQSWLFGNDQAPNYTEQMRTKPTAVGKSDFSYVMSKVTPVQPHPTISGLKTLGMGDRRSNSARHPKVRAMVQDNQRPMSLPSSRSRLHHQRGIGYGRYY